MIKAAIVSSWILRIPLVTCMKKRLKFLTFFTLYWKMFISIELTFYYLQGRLFTTDCRAEIYDLSYTVATSNINFIILYYKFNLFVYNGNLLSVILLQEIKYIFDLTFNSTRFIDGFLFRVLYWLLTVCCQQYWAP